MKKARFLIIIVLVIFCLVSCGKGTDYTQEDRDNAAAAEAGRGASYSLAGDPNFENHIVMSRLIFVGTVVKTEEHILMFEGKPSYYQIFTVRIDDLWYGEAVGQEVLIHSGTFFYNNIFEGHENNQYVFILGSLRRDGTRNSIYGSRGVIPIQPSTGKMYPLYMYDGFEQLEGQPPEYLKDLIAAEQQDILKNGYDDENGRLLPVGHLRDVLMPYQVAYETGEPVYLEPPVITDLKEEALSQYEGEPYYEELVELATEEYQSRKNKRGLRESELLETLEGMLPEMVEEAEEIELQMEE